jgi:hypothetical protein
VVTWQDIINIIEARDAPMHNVEDVPGTPDRSHATARALFRKALFCLILKLYFQSRLVSIESEAGSE